MGRAWIAVREDEVAAAAMGVNLVRTKLWAYALGAALGGFAGVFLATYNNTVNVDQFEFGFSVFILSMVIIGGMGNIWGVILGAIALSMFNRYGLQAAQRRARQVRPELRRHVDQLRHLRLLPAGHDGPAARGLHPVRADASSSSTARSTSPTTSARESDHTLYDVREDR